MLYESAIFLVKTLIHKNLVPIDLVMEVSGIAIGHTADKVSDQEESQVETIFSGLPSSIGLVAVLVIVRDEDHEAMFNGGKTPLSIVVDTRRDEAVEEAP